MKLFHRTPEGCAYRPGANWFRTKGWFRLVFFCGECRLYFRIRWKIGQQWAPRAFLRWDLRKNEEPTVWGRLDEHGQWVEEKDPGAIQENEELREKAGDIPMFRRK